MFKHADIMPPMSLRVALTKIWTRDSSILLGGFFITVLLIIYIWWPLAVEYFAYVDWSGDWWLYIDWLLIGIFAFMSITIIARADLKTDLFIIFVGTCGGLAIESWGTQTNLWHYYTAERPPLWIIPAWPIASLSIDRITRGLDFGLKSIVLSGEAVPKGLQAFGGWRNQSRETLDCVIKILYWITFALFLSLMLTFVGPTFDKSYTWLSLILCILLILTPTNHRLALLTFAAGAGLGYYLELWGTTRQCWTYYTFQTPPLFAVLAHGMAAVAFWRAGLVLKTIWGRLGFSKSQRASIMEEA